MNVHPKPIPAAKRRTSVTIAGDLIDEARTFGLNVSGIAEAGLLQAVREARARAWHEENAEALAQCAARVERDGMLLARWQTLRWGERE